MTELTDKFFWPERAVMLSSPREVALPAIARLLQSGTSVYNFHPTWIPRDLNLVNQRQLKPFGLSLVPVTYGFEDHSLYRFIPSAP